MAFTSKCAIHASNAVTWRKLIALGLKQDPISPRYVERTAENDMCTVVENGYIFNMPSHQLADDLTDCGTNADLFFALAALRDDSDIAQWFVYDDRYWNDENPRRFWFVCKTDKIEDDMCENEMYNDCVKAKPKELIHHFNGKDDDDIAEL